MTEIDEIKAELAALRSEVEYLKNSLLPDVSGSNFTAAQVPDWSRIVAVSVPKPGDGWGGNS